MLTKISLGNFRSVKSAEVPLGRLNVFYGPTASGKSTLMYGVMALKAFVTNPNRPADALFNLGFIDLGGFDATIFNHDAGSTLGLGVEITDGEDPISYSVGLRKAAVDLQMIAGGLTLRLEVPLPYPANQNQSLTVKIGEELYTVNWNGIVAAVAAQKPTPETNASGTALATRLNRVPAALQAVDIAPPRRGFFKSSYSPVAVSPVPTTDDEVASLIINDQNLSARISMYADDIFKRDFRIYTAPGTATSFLQTTDRLGRVPVNLVNDGFGINQVIYLLAKLLRADVKTVLIEEPEVHLHPTVIRELARAFCKCVYEEGKQIVIATHSEQMLISLLALVEDQTLKPEDLRCYLSEKKGRTSEMHAQVVTADGQVEGGLASFVEAEVADLKKFLRAGQ